MKPYTPDRLPVQDLDFGVLVGLVGQANAELARYDGMLKGVVNPSILLSPITTQEAVLSSRIEGTQATLDEVLEHDAGQEYEEEKTRDIKEIINYRQVLLFATRELDNRPLSLNMLKTMHSVLMDSVRGQNKTPGQFRTDQNWIGPAGCSIDNATFVPPSPFQLQDHLESWEKYVLSNDIDVLIQAAIVHAQFELIHPFRDGNGRIGRLLIPLFLFSKGCVSSPVFYLSAYLEANREDYYSCLQSISSDGAWERWISFFLQGVVEQAQENASKVVAVLDLYEMMKERIRGITHSQYTVQLLDALFARPIFQTSDIVQITGLPKQTVMPWIRQLKDDGVLVTLREASGRRPGRMAFRELLNVAEGRSIV